MSVTAVLCRLGTVRFACPSVPPRPLGGSCGVGAGAVPGFPAQRTRGGGPWPGVATGQRPQAGRRPLAGRGVGSIAGRRQRVAWSVPGLQPRNRPGSRSDLPHAAGNVVIPWAPAQEPTRKPLRPAPTAVGPGERHGRKAAGKGTGHLQVRQHTQTVTGPAPPRYTMAQGSPQPQGPMAP